MPPFLFDAVPNVAILGAGTAFPSRRLCNADILRRLDPRRDERRLAFAAEALTATLGVRERSWARWPGEPDSDLADTPMLGINAARNALDDAGTRPAEVDVLLVATSTPHRWTSTVSSAIGEGLGLRAMATDIRSGCAGGLFALATAAMYVRQGARRVLVVGTDTFSKALSPGEPTTSLLLADGAGALLVGPGAGGLLGGCLFSDGALGSLVHTPGPMPPTSDAIAAGGYVLHGEPIDLADAVPELYRLAITGALEKAGVSPADIDRYLPQQAGRPVIEGVSAAFEIPRDRVWSAVDRHANIGAGSVLAAWAEARDEAFLRPNDRVLIAAVGGGMSAAALVWAC